MYLMVQANQKHQMDVGIPQCDVTIHPPLERLDSHRHLKSQNKRLETVSISMDDIYRELIFFNRQNIITVEQDNAGFAAFVHQNESVFINTELHLQKQGCTILVY